MSLLSNVLQKEEKSLKLVIDESLKILQKEIFNQIDNLIINLEVSSSFFKKVEVLENELKEPQLLNINLISKKRDELRFCKSCLNKKNSEISSILKIIYPILFSQSSLFRKNLKILFSKATKSSHREDISLEMSKLLENLDNIADLYKYTFKFETLYINLDKNNIDEIFNGVNLFKSELIWIYDYFFYFKKNINLFE